MRYLRLAPLSSAFALFLSAQLCPLSASAAPDRSPTGKTDKSAPAKAPLPDDFATLPANDPIYAYLKTTTQAGWTEHAWTAGNNEATRSEAALEVARVVFTVTARAKADTTWTDTASKPAARALRTLLVTLRPELNQLGVETREVSVIIDRILQTKPGAAFANLHPNPAPLGGNQLEIGGNPRSAAVTRNEVRGEQSETSRRDFRTRLRQTLTDNPFANTPLENAVRNATNPDSAFTISFSQRLRITTAVQSLANESGDPFGRISETMFPAPSRVGSGVSSVRANATLNITPRVALRADYSQQRLTRPVWGLRDGLLNGLDKQSEFGGGLDVTPLDSMKFSGGVSRQDDGLKVAGGVRFSAWQNRLTLGANLSRLLPEDSQAFAATATQFDVNFGLTQSVTFNLLYQSLFRADSQAHPERFLGIGLGFKL